MALRIDRSIHESVPVGRSFGLQRDPGALEHSPLVAGASQAGPETPRSRTIHGRGRDLIDDPLLNKGTAFTRAERDAFGLHGLLPPRVNTIEEQVALELEHVRRKARSEERRVGKEGGCRWWRKSTIYTE